MDLNEVSIFIRVIQTGSFTKAARELGMPNSTVSSKVSSLERRLGVALIQRTTRKLHVTAVGEAFFSRCIQGLEAIRHAEAEILAGKVEPQGLLRFTAPVELGSSLLPSIVSGFTKKHPKVSVEVILTDRRVDLLGEGVDLALRAGDLKDSSLIAKKLGSVYFAPFASPQYLKKRGIPASPKDLKEHELLQFLPFGTGKWTLTNDRSTQTVSVPGRLVVNDLGMIKQLALNSDGIALLPTFFCYPEVKTGKLARVLPEWHSNRAPVSFVYPGQKYVMPNVSAFIEYATAMIRAAIGPIQ